MTEPVGKALHRPYIANATWRSTPVFSYVTLRKVSAPNIKMQKTTDTDGPRSVCAACRGSVPTPAHANRTLSIVSHIKMFHTNSIPQIQPSIITKNN